VLRSKVDRLGRHTTAENPAARFDPLPYFYFAPDIEAWKASSLDAFASLVADNKTWGIGKAFPFFPVDVALGQQDR
jgi:hypothetical protein